MDNLTRSFANFNQSVEKNYPIIPGEIGISLGGSRITEVPGRGQFVYVRLRSNQSEIVQVFNGKVFPGYGLPVLVKWNNNRYEIIGVDVQRYQQWVADNPHIAKHGATHSMDKENDRIGTDPVWVYPYQFMPSLVAPFPQSGIQNVYINPLMVQYGNGWTYIGNTGTSNLASYKPTSGSSIVLISLDVTNGNPYLYSTTGTYIPLSTTGTSDLLSYLPSLDLGRYIPLSFVLLTSGTSGIAWNNLYDVRQFFTPLSTGSSYLSVNGAYPIDSLVFSGANFVGSGTSAFIDIVAGGGGGGSFYPSFIVDGYLETGTSQSQPYLVTDDFTSDYAYLYLENLGTTGTTKVDLLKNGISIFTGGYQLQIPYNSTGSWVRAVPYHSSFILGDILTLSVTQKATGAGNLLSIIAPTPSSSGGGTITIYDGITTVSSVDTVKFPSGTVGNLGGGEAQILLTNFRYIVFDGSTTTAGQSQNRTSAGTYTSHSAYITLFRPIKLNSVKWDVSSAKTYSLKLYRGWQNSSVLADLGTQVTTGRTAAVTWSAGDRFLPAGHYMLELSWTGAAVVDDNTTDSSPGTPNVFSFFMIERSQYNTSFDTGFSPAIQLVAYLGTEELA